MKIATLNINNVNKRLQNLLEWLGEARPDVVCLQALKAAQNAFPAAYKLAWLERLIAHAATLQQAGIPIALAGDYNVVPTDADIYPSRSWAKDALLQPESRTAFSRLLAQGRIDAIRAAHPTRPIYTFWDYKRDRWRRDAGLRIDHILLSPALSDRLETAGMDRDVRGREGASDHAPAWVVLRPVSGRARQDRKR